MDMQGSFPYTAETDERAPMSPMPAGKRASEIGVLEESATRAHLQIVPRSSAGKLPANGDEWLAALAEYRKAVQHRLETEQAWAGNNASGRDGALAVINALKAENAALAHHLRLKFGSAIRRETPHSAAPSNPLTEREQEVLELVVDGKTTKEIAFILGIAFKTAACHRCRILDKLGVHSTAGMIRVAVELGLVDL